MEKWHAYQQTKIQIELIDYFIGGNQDLKVYITGKDRKQQVLHFDFVWDFRYAIENAFIDRCADMRRQKNIWVEDSGIYIVENSKYIKYFERQISGTRPIDDLKHFLIFDEIDTGLEILTRKEPTISAVKI